MTEAIKRLFQDPGWWVTAVFVALLISILAGFIKDAISKTLARSSTTFREWRQRRRAAFLREAESLARDFSLILYMRLMALGMMILWSTTLIMMIGFYILLNVPKTHTELATVMLFVSGIVSFFPYFRGIHFLNLSSEAKRIYTERNFS